MHGTQRVYTQEYTQDAVALVEWRRAFTRQTGPVERAGAQRRWFNCDRSWRGYGWSATALKNG